MLQTRGIGVLEAFREGLPTWGAEAFAAATHLGDTATLVVLAALVYLAYDRRAGSFVVGTLLVGFGVVVALKGWFILARPPADLQFVAAYGYGFPSGHAVGATVGWGATALALDGVWTRRRRLAAAGAVAGVVALSRVAIGVHYLVDVVVGVALGLLVLAAAVRWGREAPLRLLVGAVLVALVAVAVTGADGDAAALLGATVGGATAWQVVEPADRPWGRPGVVASAGGGVLALGGLALAGPPAVVAFGAGALLSAGIFLAPVAAEQWLDGGLQRLGTG